MKISAYILTCPQRAYVMQQTLANLSQTDWAEEPKIRLDVDQNQQINSLNLLKQSQSDNFDYLLFLEDDLEFNLNIRHNLYSWDLLQNRHLIFGTLYHPDRTMIHCQPTMPEGGHCYSYPTKGRYNSQALLLHRSVIPFLISHWCDEIFTTEWQDVRIRTLLAPSHPVAYCYHPNLVQHVGEESTWGGKNHSSQYFDKTFRN